MKDAVPMVAVGREELLEAVEDDDKSVFMALLHKHESKADPFDIDELLTTLTKKQLTDMWSHLQLKATTTLLSFDTQGSDHEQQQEVQEAAAFLNCVLTVAMATIGPDQPTIPNQLFGTAVVLHGILANLPDDQDKLKNNIAKLCEAWWQRELEGRADLAPQTFLYLLQRTLGDKATGADMKRVWKMRDILRSVDLQNTSAEGLKEHLLAAYWSPLYLKHDDGVKFLAFVMDINANFTEQIHNTVKCHLPQSPKAHQAAYGKIYFKAWRVATGPILETLEKGCLQDLMHRAVLAPRSGPSALFFIVCRVLNQIHCQNKQRGVGEMLVRLYEPILWRNLKVANPLVRANAAALLIDTFPLQDADSDILERDRLMQKQFDTFTQLLCDSCPTVRALAAQGICQIIQVYWELIPGQTIKALIAKLVQDLAWDSTSIEVRQTVVKGLSVLLDNHLSHPLLKVILPEMKNMFHDTAEKVRVAFSDLLLKVKQLHTIKFWTVAPLDHIMARLEVDTPAVCRRLVELLYSSCFPEDRSADEMLIRCVDLIEKYPGSIRRFYQYGVKHMSFSTAVKFLVLICRALKQVVLKATRRQHKQSVAARRAAQAAGLQDDILESFCEEDKENTQDTEEEDDDEEDEDGENELLTVNKTEVIYSLLEIAVIVWSANAHVLKKPVNQKALTELQRRYSLSLPEFFKMFQEPKIVSALIMLAGFLPPAAIPTFSRGTLSKLKHMKQTENTVADYGTIIESMCKWGRVDDILEVVSEWMSSALTVPDTPSASKCAKRGRGVMFAEPVEPQPLLALQYTHYLTQHAACREMLLTHNRDSTRQLADDLKAVLNCIEKRMTSAHPGVNDLMTDDFLVQTFESYLKMEVILHDKNTQENNAIRKMEDLLTWADTTLVSTLRKTKPHKKSRKLMRTADATLLASPTEGAGLSSPEGSNQTMMFETLMSQTVMSQTVMSETMSETMFGQKRPAGDVSEAATLACKFLEHLLSICSEMLLVGVADTQLVTRMADFSSMLLQLDGASELLPKIFKVMYQITEMTSTLEPQEEDGNVALNSTIVPDMLNKAMPMLARLVRVKPTQAEKVLPSIKPALSEILTSYFHHNSLDVSTSRDLMGTVMAAVVSEVTQHVTQDNQLESYNTLTALPLLSSFFMTMLQRTSALLGLFLCELCGCVQSGSLEQIEALLAVTHLLYAISLTKVKSGNSGHLKDCLTALHTEVYAYSVEPDIPENSPVRGMHETAKTMLADCMERTGMEAPVLAATT